MRLNSVFESPYTSDIGRSGACVSAILTLAGARVGAPLSL
jgi:hypothetical protein